MTTSTSASKWRTKPIGTDFLLRLRVKCPETWTTFGLVRDLRGLSSIEDRYWARSATERLKNPKWISEKEFWRRLGPVS